MQRVRAARLRQCLKMQSARTRTRDARPLRHAGCNAQMARAAALLNRLRRTSRDQLRIVFDFLTKPVSDILDGWFENDLVKSLFAFDAVVGNFASPYTVGTAYGLLHHAFGEVNGKKRVWGHAIGGMGAVTQAMARAAKAHGVDVETNAPVREVLVENRRARGVILADGRVVRARIVAANVNPRLLYTALIPASLLEPEFRSRIGRWRCESGTFRMNVALSQLPRFSALPGNGVAPHHSAGIIIAPSLNYMDRAHADARRFGWSRDPIIEMLIPSTLDTTLAPPGAHVASLFCQHAAPNLPDAMSWHEQRDHVAKLMIETVERYAPGFKASVLGYQALSPSDLEETFGLIGGDIFHGVQSLDQMFWARPMLGYADYRGPLKGLYHCGSGAHPGGGVTGAPGHNAARVHTVRLSLALYLALIANCAKAAKDCGRTDGTGPRPAKIPACEKRLTQSLLTRLVSGVMLLPFFSRIRRDFFRLGAFLGRLGSRPR